MAFDLAKKINKPIIIFEGPNRGKIISFENDKIETESFSGDIYDIVSKMKDDSAIFIIQYTLEYVDATKIDLNDLIKELDRVSGGQLYIIGFEKNSPRNFWDYKIKNILDKPYYLPTDKQITWISPNGFTTIWPKIL